MEEQTWNYSGEFLKRAKIIISDKQILLENRGLSFMRFPCKFIYSLFGVFPTFVTIQRFFFISNAETLRRRGLSF